MSRMTGKVWKQAKGKRKSWYIEDDHMAAERQQLWLQALHEVEAADNAAIVDAIWAWYKKSYRRRRSWDVAITTEGLIRCYVERHGPGFARFFARHDALDPNAFGPQSSSQNGVRFVERGSREWFVRQAATGAARSDIVASALPVLTISLKYDPHQMELLLLLAALYRLRIDVVSTTVRSWLQPSHHSPGCEDCINVGGVPHDRRTTTRAAVRLLFTPSTSLPSGPPACASLAAAKTGRISKLMFLSDCTNAMPHCLRRSRRKKNRRLQAVAAQLSASPPAPWTTLPNELWSIIMHKLAADAVADIVALSATCTRLLSLARDPLLWRSIARRVADASPAVMAALAEASEPGCDWYAYFQAAILPELRSCLCPAATTVPLLPGHGHGYISVHTLQSERRTQHTGARSCAG
ncbi:uncharacterized protein AMSG_09149 [Thecamonas trahens ATCC 50062]|uniref:F-box domain-containing protein n=1 Tax=Thecamonas trahens ATCC 50062 TaxID=461836 RepID=A0A0L0DKS1_THETB|nr:hypothetical protein AMSG_09149 [Thecamonas trahens ATCC 50062]KNC52974.1 hypothetical protein AMSG_09149 [Thecamonas trahens ATCC 50062]|eukprot:XP_013754864.1 hypothetical protein AMSG_09149 [Thecamonas trahens ATCC 50062]